MSCRNPLNHTPGKVQWGMGPQAIFEKTYPWIADTCANAGLDEDQTQELCATMWTYAVAIYQRHAAGQTYRNTPICQIQSRTLQYLKKHAARATRHREPEQIPITPDMMRRYTQNEYVRALFRRDIRPAMASAMETLPPGVEPVIRKIYGIDEPQANIRQVADQKGRSHTRISQIHQKGLRCMRHPNRMNLLRGCYGAVLMEQFYDTYIEA